MRRALLLLILPAAGCGFIGGPLPPLANVPARIADLAAIQRGANLIVHGTLPAVTTENVLIATPLDLDLRIGTAAVPFKPEDWAARAKAVSGAQIKDGLATWSIPSQEWINKQVAIGVRAIGANSKASDWSNFETLQVVAPPETPAHVEVTDTAAGERITWTGKGDRFRVLRRAAGEEGYTIAATTEGHEFTDPGIEYGQPYTYMVQALVDAGNQRIAESDLSPPVPKTPKDTFPPAVPSGLRADVTPNSIVLAWDPDSEPDLAGYRVYRATGDSPPQKLAELNGIPSYTDPAVEHGKTYRYSVSAFDKAGNESQRSAPQEIVFP